MSILAKKLLGLLNRPGKRNKKSIPPIIPFDEAKKLGIIYTWDGQKKEKEVEDFIQLIIEDKTVDVLCYNPTKEVIDTQHSTVSLNDLTALGKLNSEIAREFTNKSFDFIFHFDFELNDIIRSILVQTNARCRVGHHSADDSAYYELMIGINKSVGMSNFGEQMIKYVKAIR